MNLIGNPHRANGPLHPEVPFPSVAAENVARLLRLCPVADATPLVETTGLAPVASLWIKDERTRMGLGSFKALGAAYVIARAAAEIEQEPGPNTLAGQTYVTASAGNHGLSVAAGARVFGADAVVFIAQTVPESFAKRLQGHGAKVVLAGANYAASMAAAQLAAADNGWTLLSDSSWDGYTTLPHILMEGYLQMAAEAVDQCPTTPTHIFLQAGVGGLAGAVAAYARKIWGDAPQIIVVEPEAAPALQASIKVGHSVFADGPESTMGRLDCKEPSLIALNGLARDADSFVTLTDDEVETALPELDGQGLATTASGAAGIAGAMNGALRKALDIGADAHVLCVLSEVAE